MDDDSKVDTFIGTQTVAHFFRSVMNRMAEEGESCVEMEMDIAGKTVSFEINIVSIEEKQ